MSRRGDCLDCSTHLPVVPHPFLSLLGLFLAVTPSTSLLIASLIDRSIQPPLTRVESTPPAFLQKPDAELVNGFRGAQFRNVVDKGCHGR